MAYSSSGKKIYASIKDLPQYTSLGNGDKIIIWNETRDGAAVVDFKDLIIDLEHTSFKSTISEVLTLASDIQSFVHTVNEEINGISESLTEVQTTVDHELKNRVKALEYILAVILGSNSYWTSAQGLDILREEFLINGIAPVDNETALESDELLEQEALSWFNGFMGAVVKYINKVNPGATISDILLQPKFQYRYTDKN
jgi:hypothetical protein